MTLNQLGYQAVTLQLGDPTVPRFTFDLTQLPHKDGLFTLIYGHSSTATPALSSVRVDLNGNPLVSRSFEATDPPRIRWRIPLPVDQVHVGTNVVTVRFFLGAPGTNCIAPPASSVWASIDPSSSLTLPATQGPGYPDLSLVPFPMVVNGDLNQTLLIVPGRGAAAEVPSGEALNTAVLLGAASQVDAPQLTVLAADQVTPAQLRGRTVILDGLPQGIPLMARMQVQLPLRLAMGGTLELTGQTAAPQATAGEPSAVGVIEELPSPWDATQTAVLVSASQPRLLPLTQHTLFRANLSGTAATVDAAGRVQTFDTRTPAEAAAGGASRGRPIRVMTFAGLGLLLAVVVLMALRSLRMEGKLR
jgi:hypothetical protein